MVNWYLFGAKTSQSLLISGVIQIYALVGLHLALGWLRGTSLRLSISSALLLCGLLAPVWGLLLKAKRMNPILRQVLLLKSKRVIHQLLIGLGLIVQSWICSHKIPDHSRVLRYALPNSVVWDCIVLIVIRGGNFLFSRHVSSCLLYTSPSPRD